jgi:hypothetical protein
MTASSSGPRKQTIVTIARSSERALMRPPSARGRLPRPPTLEGNQKKGVKGAVTGIVVTPVTATQPQRAGAR